MSSWDSECMRRWDLRQYELRVLARIGVRQRTNAYITVAYVGIGLHIDVTAHEMEVRGSRDRSKSKSEIQCLTPLSVSYLTD